MSCISCLWETIQYVQNVMAVIEQQSIFYFSVYKVERTVCDVEVYDILYYWGCRK